MYECACAHACNRACSVLQCVSVCCSVLQCVAVCGSVLQCVAACRDELYVLCLVMSKVHIHSCMQCLPCWFVTYNHVPHVCGFYVLIRALSNAVMYDLQSGTSLIQFLNRQFVRTD